MLVNENRGFITEKAELEQAINELQEIRDKLAQTHTEGMFFPSDWKNNLLLLAVSPKISSWTNCQYMQIYLQLVKKKQKLIQNRQSSTLYLSAKICKPFGQHVHISLI